MTMNLTVYSYIDIVYVAINTQNSLELVTFTKLSRISTHNLY